jgi:hypothetical protein
VGGSPGAGSPAAAISRTCEGCAQGREGSAEVQAADNQGGQGGSASTSSGSAATTTTSSSGRGSAAAACTGSTSATAASTPGGGTGTQGSTRSIGYRRPVRVTGSRSIQAILIEFSYY